MVSKPSLYLRMNEVEPKMGPAKFNQRSALPATESYFHFFPYHFSSLLFAVPYVILQVILRIQIEDSVTIPIITIVYGAQVCSLCVELTKISRVPWPEVTKTKTVVCRFNFILIYVHRFPFSDNFMGLKSHGSCLALIQSHPQLSCDMQLPR